MKHKTKQILAVALCISSSQVFAAGTPYVGGSLGFGGYSSSGGYAGNINLFGGYGSTLGDKKKFYLGGELNVFLGRSYGNNYGAGLSILPGLMLNDSTMLYARLGGETSKNYRLGTLWGLGMQTELTKNFSLRGEYTNQYSHGSSGGLSLGLVYKFL